MFIEICYLYIFGKISTERRCHGKCTVRGAAENRTLGDTNFTADEEKRSLQDETTWVADRTPRVLDVFFKEINFFLKSQYVND